MYRHRREVNVTGRPGICLAFSFFWRMDIIVTANSKKFRDQAETFFSKTQTQSLALSRIISEHDAVSQAREEKTARLRELRLEKEAKELAAGPAPKRKGKP
jgi:hypothetical protein